MAGGLAIGELQVKELHGVEVGALPANGKVEVRAGDSAGSSAEAQALAFFDVVTRFYVDAGEMHVEGLQVLTVVKQHEVSFVKHSMRKTYDAIVCSVDGGAGGGSEVCAAVNAGEGSVEGAAGAEGVSGAEGYGWGEGAGPEDLWIVGGEGVVFEEFFFGDAGLGGGVWGKEFALDGDFAGAICGFGDGDLGG